MTTHGTVEATARPAGRPRSAKAEKAIIDATLDLMGEGVGISELSIEAIATRAGVGKTTIYRRWSNKEDLVVDALAALKAPLPPLPGTSVREDLICYLDAIRQESRHPRLRCVMHLAQSEYERHPRLAERFHEVAIEPRRRTLRAVLQRGIDNGELRPGLNVEIAMAAIVGTMIWLNRWQAVSAEEPPGSSAADVVDELLRGFGANPGA
ncbi:AcrR family transcriptional regulator [Thermocatellispora tengchongensis]|uniref:AcrR family transcriptional regulator n=1 Tax=Thermocatellispora tengchongensis TaxID=1073253 RepID=A0A840NZ71_9ACTN|nr:TetR/AcrR family transcriptional regulator [Thermocatellispora tengchongensis]MBB5132788.1 AcrR family transcriptional regulator [Thermocatellispora tengchongensis]